MNGDHELVQALLAQGLAPHEQLRSMLNEHHEHCTERRGCGLTQATRLLAAQINQERLKPLPRSRVFEEHLNSDELVQRMHATEGALFERLQFPESKLLAAWIRDIVLRGARGNGFHAIALTPLKVGSCPLAEQFFLEVAHGRIRRGGRVNVIVGEDGLPLLIEKRGLGDEHSCINVADVVVNGVNIPKGSLFGVDYPESALEACRSTKDGTGVLIPLAMLDAARLLRLTTLAVSPADRRRAFSAHFQQQMTGGLYSPDTTTIEQLVEFAREQSA